MQDVILLYAHLGDNELIAHVHSGKKICFELLMRHHNPALYRVGRMYGFEDADIEDLMHDTHLEAYSKLKTFDGRVSYRTWITGVMLQKCRDKLQTMNRQYELSVDYEGPAGHLIRKNNMNLSAHGYAASGIDLTTESLDQLPVSKKVMYMLKEVEGFSLKDTARLLNMPENSLQHQIEKIKSSVRKTRRRPLHGEHAAFNPVRANRIIKRTMNMIGRG